ncbi:MAG: nucleotide exchange factor GrpE [Isosphaeraceae bacterium]|nr:nucleotide exchange factor GrpE [Isosphaeraceae bacterium]
MSDEPTGENEIIVPSPPEPGAEIAADVALVVPAAAYESIATDDAPLTPFVAPVDGQAATLAALATLGDSLHRRLEGLHTLFEREIRAEATREKVVDRLHAELQEYKQDLLLNVLRPVFVDLIQLHDDIGKIVAAHPLAEGEPRRLLDLMAGFQQGIEDILYRQGVEPYSLEGDTFDPKRQRAVATVPTDDPSQNKSIAARHRKGFQALAGEKLIRPEIVSVHALRKPG